MTEHIAGSSRRREGHNLHFLRGDPEKIVLGGRRQHLGRARGVLVHAKSLQSRPTLCDPTDYSLPGSSVHGVLWQEYCSGLPCPPPGGLPDPGIKPRLLCLLLWQAGSLTLVPLGSRGEEEGTVIAGFF